MKTFPTTRIYGEASFDVSINSFIDLYFIVKYHHFTNTITAQDDIFIEGTEWDTNALQKEIVLYYFEL